MNEEHRGVAPASAKRDSHDGLAAVAIAILTVCLIAFAVIKII